MARPSNKEAILKEAFKLFLSKGFDAVSFSDLVEATGISRGGMFHHFKGKEDIFNQVADRFVFDFLKQNEPLNEDIDSLTPLKTFLHKYIEKVEKRMQYFSASFGDAVNSASFMSFILYLKNHYAYWGEKFQVFEKQELAKWSEAIMQSKKSGEIRDDVEDSQLIDTFRNIYLGLSYKGALVNRLSIDDLQKLWNFVYKGVIK